jgi:hypothetical protein
VDTTTVPLPRKEVKTKLDFDSGPDVEMIGDADKAKSPVL